MKLAYRNENKGQASLAPLGRLQSQRDRRIKKGIFMGVMMAPAIVGFLVFYVYVNFNSLIMAFTVTENNQVSFSFQNFAYFFNELKNPFSVFTEAIRNTLIFFLLGYVQMFLSFLVAYFVFKQVVGYKYFRFVYYLPCIIMSTVTASLVQYVTATDGPLSDLIVQITGGVSLWKTDATANVMLGIYMLFFGIGGNMILFLGSMTNIDPEIFEAARLDGVGWVREMFQLILPLIWQTFSVMLLTSITSLTQASGAVFLFTKGSNGTYTINYWLYAQLLNGTNLEVSAAIGWCCTAITFPLALIARKLLNKADEKLGG